MQALKGLVVGLGLLIVIGAIGLGYGFYVKYHNKDAALFKGTADTAPAAVSPPIVGALPAAGFGEVRLNLPDGCGVTEMRPDGNRLYLRTGPTGLCERIVIVDVTTGGVLGTIVVRP